MVVLVFNLFLSHLRWDEAGCVQGGIAIDILSHLKRMFLRHLSEIIQFGLGAGYILGPMNAKTVPAVHQVRGPGREGHTLLDHCLFHNWQRLWGPVWCFPLGRIFFPHIFEQHHLRFLVGARLRSPDNLASMGQCGHFMNTLKFLQHIVEVLKEMKHIKHSCNHLQSVAAAGRHRDEE